LETYHGALVIDLRSLDLFRWMTFMLDLVAHPHSSIPYVQTGFSTGCSTIVMLRTNLGTFVLHVAFVCICDESHLLKCLSQLHLVIVHSSVFAQQQKIFRNTNLKPQLHRKFLYTYNCMV